MKHGVLAQRVGRTAPGTTWRESSVDARHAQLASSLRYDRFAAGTPCPTPHRGVGGVLGKATALGHDVE